MKDMRVTVDPPRKSTNLPKSGMRRPITSKPAPILDRMRTLFSEKPK